MRATRVAVVIILGALLLASQSGAAQRFENVPEAKPADQAAPAAGIKIGVINFQLAMANTQEGKKASDDLRAQFSPRQAELEKEERVNRLGTKLKRVIDLYGADKGFHIVLDYSQSNTVAFFTPAADITEDVVRLYDQAYPVQAAQPPAQPPAPRPAAPPRSNPPPK